MVVVACPHCDEGIELPDTAEGLFECPHCDEEFEWGVESDLEHQETVQPRDFWIGLSVPFLSMCFGFLLTVIIVGDSWDGLLWAFLSLLLWPALALGIAIWGYLNHRGLLWIGASVSLAISTPLVLLLILGWL
ncbi:MAG TPA: hypothetical protein D7H91_04140 [Candidatus Poseidoniales archaeon]|nr:MAG TPA: hypothetical protein D7H91_04140 [Candidatus Poseidoniales archaeon]HII78210.1 hypothetical protein [Poseidonia sp.]|tara:strand:- start:36098 stop:36496 length:399 start_codon:yes stop_codon:yes gene_type:complete